MKSFRTALCSSMALLLLLGPGLPAAGGPGQRFTPPGPAQTAGSASRPSPASGPASQPAAPTVPEVRLAADTGASDIPNRLVVELKPGTNPDLEAAEVGARVVRRGPLNFAVLALPQGASENEVKARLMRLPGILSVEKSTVIKAAGQIQAGSVISDPGYQKQWALNQTGVPQAWGMGATGAGVVIAIVDTGVDLNHPDLRDNLLPGYNAITGSSAPGAAQDDNGHGTHVAGIAAAALNGIGMVGVAYQAKILPVKVLGSSGEGADDVIASGIVWAADHGAQIINLSLGSGSETGILSQALQYASAKGCLVVAAAGNFTPGVNHNPGITYPASDPNVLAVTATDSSDKVAGFSDTGPEAALAAPGVNIYSDYWSAATGPAYAIGDGTSMAAPIAAGTAALVWSKHPGWTARQVRIALENGAKDLGPAGRDSSYGFGRVDAAAALSLAAPPLEMNSPAVVSRAGGIVEGGTSTSPATLQVPELAFDQAENVSLSPVQPPAGFPPGIQAAGGAVSVDWGGVQPRRILTLTFNGVSPPGPGVAGYLYRWSGTRWIQVGGGSFSPGVSAGTFIPGIFRVGYSALSLGSRIAGPDRVQTAVNIAKAAYPTGADTVILARADDFPDALAGAPLAYKDNAPILLTYPDSLPSQVLAEIQALAPQNIIILGGPGAVSAGIADQLQALAAVERLWGPDRYATAAAIAQAMGTLGQAVLVNGTNFPDALSIAAAAAQNGEPILLTPASGLAQAADQALRQLSVSDTLVIGGDGVVPDQLLQSVANPVRVAGSDRYGTSAAVLRIFPPRGSQVYIATGNDFPDALAGGPLAAIQGSDVVIVPPAGLTPSQLAVLQSWHNKTVTALGGTGVVSDAVAAEVQETVQ